MFCGCRSLPPVSQENNAKTTTRAMTMVYFLKKSLTFIAYKLLPFSLVDIHDALHDALLCCFLRSQLPGHLSLGEDIDAVAHAQKLRHLG